MIRLFSALALVLGLAACGVDDLHEPPAEMGDFLLGHNIVVAPDVVKGPLSREADVEKLIATTKKAIDARFARYDGDSYYHFGVNLSGYVLAQPGIPLVLSPKSALIFTLTVWDDKTGKKLNAKPQQITVLESLSGDTIVGSGLTKTADQQLDMLAYNAAKAIEKFMTANRQWFGPKPGSESQPAVATAAKPK